MPEQNEGYQPSEDEVQKAEDMMTPNEKWQSEVNEANQVIERIKKEQAEQNYGQLMLSTEKIGEMKGNYATAVANELGNVYVGVNECHLRIFGVKPETQPDIRRNSNPFYFSGAAEFIESKDLREINDIITVMQKRLQFVERIDMPKPRNWGEGILTAMLLHFQRKEKKED